MRDKLIELISQVQYMGGLEGKLADYLITNGVIVPPVRVGQVVWVYNKSKANVYENTIVSVKIKGESRYKNKITVEYHNARGESSYRKYTWAQIGKQVFFTEQDAIEALAEDLRSEARDNDYT